MMDYTSNHFATIINSVGMNRLFEVGSSEQCTYVPTPLTPNINCAVGYPDMKIEIRVITLVDMEATKDQ